MKEAELAELLHEVPFDGRDKAGKTATANHPRRRNSGSATFNLFLSRRRNSGCEPLSRRAPGVPPCLAAPGLGPRYPTGQISNLGELCLSPLPASVRAQSDTASAWASVRAHSALTAAHKVRPSKADGLRMRSMEELRFWSGKARPSKGGRD